MESWIIALCTELDRPAGANVAILDVAKMAAHQVARPAAPVAAFLLGVAVAGEMEVVEAAATMKRLAASWATAPQ